MAEKQLSDGGPDGAVLGQSASDLIAFYGATPVAQPSDSAQAQMTTAVPTTTTPFGFNQAQATHLIYFQREVSRILTLLGLWKGSI